MRYDFSGRFGRAVQILGLVVVSVFYSAQSLASRPPSTWESLGLASADLVVNDSSPDTINLYFIVSTAIIDQEKNNHQASIAPWYGNYEILRKVVADETVTLSNGKTFELKYEGGFTDSFDTTGQDIGFTIEFSKTKLLSEFSSTGKNNIPFYPFISSNGYPQNYYYADISLGVLIDAYAHIRGLEDVTLPQSIKEGFCVASTTESVRLNFQATNSASAFQLKASDSENPHVIDYKITLEGKKNKQDKTKILNSPGFKGQKWDAHLIGASDTDCIGNDNMFLRVDFKDQQQADNAPPGEYKDTITVTVSPAS